MTETIEVPQQAFQDLKETVKRQGDRIDHLEEENEDLKETVEDQADRLEMQSDLIHRLTDRVDDQAENFGNVYSRLEEMEAGEDPVSPPEPGPGGGGIRPETVLEWNLGYNQEQAFKHLTANKERAWFIAKDITDHAKKAPAGYTIDSNTIKNVIAGKEEKRPHEQTVTRIIEFLDAMGEDTVQVKKRHGKKRVIFDHDAAERMTAYHDRCAGTNEAPPPAAVISG